MKTKRELLLVIVLTSCSTTGFADEFDYESVAKRFPDTQLSAESVAEAKMHGECLVGLKQIIFVKRDYFDPVAEWINYRTNSLLEQIPPCNVLVMMEVARKELIDEEEPAP